MSAPPERRLATGARRGPTEAASTASPAEVRGDGPGSPAPPTDTHLADGSPRPVPTGEAAVPQATAAPPDAGDSPMRAAVSVLTTLGPPLTIATALMFYFGWARSDVQARYMGLDVSLFGFSTQDYVLQSISTLYVPLLATAALALGWLALHQRVDRALAQPTARPTLRLAGLVALGAGLLAAAGAVLVAVLDRNRWPLAVPLVLAVGTAVAAYGGWLAGAADPQPPGPAGAPWQRALRALLVGTVITLALFWEMSVYAGVVGRGYALELARTLPSRPRATAFSPTPLGIEAPGVHEQRLLVSSVGGRDEVRYRTTGLRFLVRSGGRLFLVHDGWTPRRGMVIVLPDNDQVRWQFSR
jgi:hypothetical protein